MKRLIVLALALALILAMTACASTNPSTNPSTTHPVTTHPVTIKPATLAASPKTGYYYFLPTSPEWFSLGGETDMATLLQQAVSYIEATPTSGSFQVKVIQNEYKGSSEPSYSKEGKFMYDADTGIIQITLGERLDGPNVFKIGQKTIPNWKGKTPYWQWIEDVLEMFEDRNEDPNTPWFSFADESIDTAPFSPQNFWSAWTDDFACKLVVADQLYGSSHYEAPILRCHCYGSAQAYYSDDLSLVAQSRTSDSIPTLAKKYEKGKWDGSLIRNGQVLAKVNNEGEIVTWNWADYSTSDGRVDAFVESGNIWSHTWIFPGYGAFDQYEACATLYDVRVDGCVRFVKDKFVSVTEQGLSIWYENIRADYAFPNTKRVVFRDSNLSEVIVLTDKGCWRVMQSYAYGDQAPKSELQGFGESVYAESPAPKVGGAEFLKGYRLIDYTSDKSICLVETPEGLIWVQRCMDANCEGFTTLYCNRDGLPDLTGLTADQVTLDGSNIIIKYDDRYSVTYAEPMRGWSYHIYRPGD